MKDFLRDSHLTALTEQATRKAIGRRRFMEGALAAGLTVSAASALWSSKVEAAEPKKGGTFRVGMHDGNTTDDLDPGTTESVYMIQMNHAIRSYLTEITNTNDIGPDAAESWEASDDASVWTFKLFEGMTFHNGKPFTAEDAVASLNYHRGEDSKSAAKASAGRRRRHQGRRPAHGGHQDEVGQRRPALPLVGLSPRHDAVGRRRQCRYQERHRYRALQDRQT